MLHLGKHKIPSRITVKRLKQVKERTGIDLTGQDTGPMLRFATDPAMVIEVAYALYRDHFKESDISEDDLGELCGPDEIDAIREEVVEQMLGFSIFWKILPTVEEALQTGDMSQIEATAARVKAQVPSGLSS